MTPSAATTVSLPAAHLSPLLTGSHCTLGPHILPPLLRSAAPAYSRSSGLCARLAKGPGKRSPLGLLPSLPLLTRPFRPRLKCHLLREVITPSLLSQVLIFLLPRTYHKWRLCCFSSIYLCFVSINPASPTATHTPTHTLTHTHTHTHTHTPWGQGLRPPDLS